MLLNRGWWRAQPLASAVGWRGQVLVGGVRLYAGKPKPHRAFKEKQRPRDTKSSWLRRQHEKRLTAGNPRSAFELICGLATVKAALLQGRREMFGVFVQRETEGDIMRDRIKEIAQLAVQQDIPVAEVSKARLDEMLPMYSHQGIAMKTAPYSEPRLLSLSPFANGSYHATTADANTGLEVTIAHQPRRRFPLWVAAYDLQDQRNFGSIIRSALFFGADAVMTSRGCACKVGPLVSRISVGAMECMDIYRANNYPRTLGMARESGWKVMCATTSTWGTAPLVAADDLPRLSAPTILVIGNEETGVSDEILKLSDTNVHIPARADIPSHIDSLNAGVAAGVVMAAIRFEGE